MSKAFQFAVLTSALLVIVVVQALPQVDLPDTTFHRHSSRNSKVPAHSEARSGESHHSGLVRRHKGLVGNAPRKVVVAHFASRAAPAASSVLDSLLA
jgi:hypothetical protein